MDLLRLPLRDRGIQRTNPRLVYITSHFSPEMLWPPGEAWESLLWPNLEVLWLTLPLTTPEGHWYFTGDPKIGSHAEFSGDHKPRDTCAEDDDDHDKNTLRILPDPDKLNPLLIAMAPDVRYLRFCLAGASNELNPKHQTNRQALKPRSMFRLEHYASGETGDGHDTLAEKRSTVWQVGDWVPCGEVLAFWWQAVGPDGRVIFESAGESRGVIAMTRSEWEERAGHIAGD